jgi:predicted nucleic acid-binding protein
VKYILDTCVISELIKPHPSSRVVSWVDSHPEENLFLTSITIGEIQRGIFKLTKSQKKTKLQNWLENELIVRFDRRILGFGLLESKTWGKIQAQAEEKGTKMPILDGLMASIAIVHNMRIATRNVSDMDVSGARLLNPWN